VVDKNYSGQFSVYRYDGDQPRCYHRENIPAIGNRCVEMNCRLIRPTSIWTSRFRRRPPADPLAPTWWGVWRERGCDYAEFTDEQLQRCVDAKKIASIRVDGRSIASYLTAYVNQRVQRLQLFGNGTEHPEALKVTLTTLHMLHRVRDSNEMIREQLRSLENATARHHIYYVHSFYTSSEREMYTHVNRLEALNRITDEELPPKGYRPLNAFDLSAAWTYDSATQRDGMHLIGPPMRMVVTKLFHFLCHDVVPDAQRV
jgi:hypothetical protein